MIVFDIETGPLPDDQLWKMFKPPDAPPHPGEFDPSSVKVGHLRDESKIAAKIADAHSKHEQAVKDYERNCEEQQAEAWSSFCNSAALDARTGQVLAIGYYSLENNKLLIDSPEQHEDGEFSLLVNFWGQVARMRESNRLMCGHNILDFDLPFLMRRSWILDVTIPEGVRNGRYFDRMFSDTLDIWMCGQRQGSVKASLNAIATALGGNRKTEGVTGADFARLWSENRELAIEYLTTDLHVTADVAIKLGVS